MRRDLNHSRHTSRDHCKRDEKVVDDPGSSYPDGLLLWLRQYLKLAAPANNTSYTPTLPTAS